MARKKLPKPTKAQLALRKGDRVHVTLDDGRIVEDKLRNDPSKLGGHTWVAWLVNHGCFFLNRCRLIAMPVADDDTPIMLDREMQA